MSDVKLLPTARETLLQLMAEWMLTTGHGSREKADAILAQHRAEVLAEASKYAPTSDVRPGWTVRVGLAEIDVQEVSDHDERTVSLVYVGGYMLLGRDEPVTVISRCDEKGADRG